MTGTVARQALHAISSGPKSEFILLDVKPCSWPEGIQMSSRSDLLDAIDGSFNQTELQEFCFRMGVDYDNLEGRNKRAKALALIQHHERREQMPDLVAAVLEARPRLELKPLVQPPVNIPDEPELSVRLNALMELLAEGGALNKTQTSALKAAIKTLRSMADRGQPLDTKAVQRVTALMAEAHLTPADRRRAERLLVGLTGALT